ncbi:MAG: hypothetical protein AAFX95_14305 [Cyanobacteria bacterium J06639_16]
MNPNQSPLTSCANFQIYLGTLTLRAVWSASSLIKFGRVWRRLGLQNVADSLPELPLDLQDALILT